MANLFEQSTLVELREAATPTGPRLGSLLLRLVLGLLSLGYLFSFVPPLLSTTLDLLTLGFLGVVSLWGMAVLLRKIRR